MQSQDYGAAKWALGQRVEGATDTELDRLYDEGAILRTHVMRPTWHFVLPEDIGWLIALTGPRLHRSLAGRYRQLEIDDATIRRALRAFSTALAGSHHLTRPELGHVLSKARISPEGQRLPHLIMAGEIRGLIGSGPRRGKQITYALLEERAPKGRRLDATEAVGELALRYFRSHGPAQLQDFVWWSALTNADARAGIAAAGKALDHEKGDGKDYWFDAAAGAAIDASTVAHLLPNFDEYSVAYRDRAAIIDHPYEPSFFSFGSVLSNVFTFGGRVRGAWRRTAVRDGFRVHLRPLDRVKRAEKAAVQDAGRRMAQFLERPVDIVFEAAP